MSKNGQKVVAGNGAKQGRLQIFAVGFAVEGGDSVLAEGFKAIKDFTEVLKGSGLIALTAPRTKGALAGADMAKQTAVVELEGSEQEEVAEPVEEDDVIDASTNGERKRKKVIPPSCSIVKDLDIASGEMPLKAYVEQKGPRKSQERVVVVASWLKKYRGKDEVNRDDLYTCYQQMGGHGDWKCINDWDTLLRTLASRKGWFAKGTKECYFNVTIVATNLVDQMVAKS
jgi:hypothetical protein